MNSRARLAGFVADTRAVAALELALFFPLLLMVMFGGWETYLWVRTVNDLERTAFSVGNVVSQRQFLCDNVASGDSANYGSYFEAAVRTAQPLDLTSNGMVILSAVINTGSGASVSWQRITPYTIPNIGSSIGLQGAAAKLPAGLDTVIHPDGVDTAIVAEVAYTYDPFPMIKQLWSTAPTKQVIFRRAFFRARLGSLGTLGTAATNSGCS